MYAGSYQVLIPTKSLWNVNFKQLSGNQNWSNRFSSLAYLRINILLNSKNRIRDNRQRLV